MGMRLMANTAFMRKLISDELYDTLYFVSGEVPVKTRTNASTILEVPRIKIKIINGRKIYFNDKEYKYSSQIKKDIQQEFAI
jgi:hypothetical protein